MIDNKCKILEAQINKLPTPEIKSIDPEALAEEERRKSMIGKNYEVEGELTGRALHKAAKKKFKADKELFKKKLMTKRVSVDKFTGEFSLVGDDFNQYKGRMPNYDDFGEVRKFIRDMKEN